jgi:hypothetical protein
VRGISLHFKVLHLPLQEQQYCTASARIGLRHRCLFKSCAEHCLGSGLVLFMTGLGARLKVIFPCAPSPICVAAKSNLDNSNLRHCRLSTNTIAATLRAPIPYPLKLKVAPAANLESAAPATTGRLMATHDRPAVPLEEEHEYGFSAPPRAHDTAR